MSSIQCNDITFVNTMSCKRFGKFCALFVQFSEGKFISVVFHIYEDERCFIWIFFSPFSLVSLGNWRTEYPMYLPNYVAVADFDEGMNTDLTDSSPISRWHTVQSGDPFYIMEPLICYLSSHSILLLFFLSHYKNNIGTFLKSYFVIIQKGKT